MVPLSEIIRLFEIIHFQKSSLFNPYLIFIINDFVKDLETRQMIRSNQQFYIYIY